MAASERERRRICSGEHVELEQHDQWHQHEHGSIEHEPEFHTGCYHSVVERHLCFSIGCGGAAHVHAERRQIETSGGAVV